MNDTSWCILPSSNPANWLRLPIFAAYHCSKCQLFGQIITSKITLIYCSQFLIQIICSNMKSLYLQQTSRSDLGIWLEFFLSTLSEGYTSAILSDPVLRISRSLVYARREFWVIVFFISVEPPSTTSKFSNPLNILLLQTRPNCLGRSWNPSTKRPERQLHSWASMSATSMFGDSVSMKSPLTSVFFQKIASTHIPA